MSKLSYKTISSQAIEKMENDINEVTKFARAGQFNYANLTDAYISGDLKNLEIHHFDWSKGELYRCIVEDVVFSDGVVHGFDFKEVNFKNVIFKNIIFKDVEFTYDFKDILSILENVTFENCRFESSGLDRIKDSSVKFLDCSLNFCLFVARRSTFEFQRCFVKRDAVNLTIVLRESTVSEPVKIVDCTTFRVKLTGDPIDKLHASADALDASFNMNIKDLRISVKYGSIAFMPNTVFGTVNLIFMRTGGITVDESTIDSLSMVCSMPVDSMPSCVVDSTINRLYTRGLKVKAFQIVGCQVQTLCLHQTKLSELTLEESTIGLVDIEVCQVTQKVALRKLAIGQVKIGGASLGEACVWETDSVAIAALEKYRREPVRAKFECVEKRQNVDGKQFKAYFSE